MGWEEQVNSVLDVCRCENMPNKDGECKWQTSIVSIIGTMCDENLDVVSPLWLS